MPRARKEPVTRSCAECGAVFANARKAAFCSPAHHRAFNNRRAARGAVVQPYLMAWIEGKGGGHSGVNPVSAKAMRELTQIVRSWIDEDRNAGRPSLIPYVDALMADSLYVDRRRSSEAL